VIPSGRPVYVRVGALVCAGCQSELPMDTFHKYHLRVISVPTESWLTEDPLRF
jgi:hypothetical protein